MAKEELTCADVSGQVYTVATKVVTGRINENIR